MGFSKNIPAFISKGIPTLSGTGAEVSRTNGADPAPQESWE
jgi:hypothetical protein